MRFIGVSNLVDRVDIDWLNISTFVGLWLCVKLCVCAYEKTKKQKEKAQKFLIESALKSGKFTKAVEEGKGDTYLLKIDKKTVLVTTVKKGSYVMPESLQKKLEII